MLAEAAVRALSYRTVKRRLSGYAKPEWWNRLSGASVYTVAGAELFTSARILDADGGLSPALVCARALNRRPVLAGSRTHTLPAALATSTAATRSITSSCSASGITSGADLSTGANLRFPL